MFSSKLRSILSRISGLTGDQNGLLTAVKILFYPGLVASLAIALIVIIVQQSGSLQPLELRMFDLLVRLQPKKKPDSRLLVVTITEADLKTQGWPLSDEVLAETLAQLQQYQPLVIGIDIYRDLSQPPGTEKLLSQLQADNIIAITNLGIPRIPPPPSIPPVRIGFNDVPVDPDGVIRRQLLFAGTEEETLFSFSLQLALFYLKSQGIEPKNYSQNPNYMQLGQGVFVPLKAWSGGYASLDDQGYQILLNYRGSQIAKSISISEILAGKLKPSLVENKIVLIGATAPSLKDVFLTPYSATALNEAMMPGVFVHAQMVSNIISVASQNWGINTPQTLNQSPRLFWFLPPGLEPIWIGIWAMIGGCVTWAIRHPFKQGIAISLGLLFLLGTGYVFFVWKGWLPLISPALAFVLTSISVIAYKQVYYLSHDPLTGLPNRISFLNKIEGKINSRRKKNIFCGILFLNVDRFKMINDSLGHQAGDQLLIELVKRLKTCLRTSDIIARLGSDEFAILIENLRQPENGICVAERIHQALISPFYLQEQEVFRTLSIGIALNDSRKGTAEELLRNANTAMYQARSQGTGNYQVFEPKMIVDGKQHLQLETDLRLALERQEFVLHYQPLISLTTGQIIGLEALIRWQHPERDLLFPDEFMSVAKETGLIIPMGQWAIKEACHQLKRIEDRYGRNFEFIMGVNLSSRQFSQPDLVEEIQDIILESGINPRNLRLEISESVLMQDVDETISLLLQLKAFNIRLSIDDFGTGFSSLSSLNRFPVDTLKIDRSFISQMEANGEGENFVIVETIITLAHVLKLAVIAEGVETLKQVEQLRLLGCEFAQGFYFLRPVPVDVALAFIESDPRW
ncbi:EAL domain-containing protein [Capilliphycus salinus ALCB114379]|uniref:EAL domain-containing protein n=1 Tax=Capilliphycus salinus TaxID=2768948 RepID=UPI0039A4433B